LSRQESNAMAQVTAKLLGITGIFCVLMLLSEPAHALRCGTKLVKEGMVEHEVVRICGSPVSTRHLGYVLRSHFRIRRGLSTISAQQYNYGHGYYEELEVTELLFNFGPRKLMRRLRFEGGRLAKIETAGYGYFEKD
jgi:hypothetical protein